MSRLLAMLTTFIIAGSVYADGLDSARTHINSMEYDQAIAIIKQHLSRHKDDIDAVHLLAKTYAWNNQYALAEQTYNALLHIEQDNTQYQFGKAQVLVWQNKFSQAVPILEGIRQHVPEQTEVWQLLILALQQSTNPEDKQRARQLTREARIRFPDRYWDF